MYRSEKREYKPRNGKLDVTVKISFVVARACLCKCLPHAGVYANEMILYAHSFRHIIYKVAFSKLAMRQGALFLFRSSINVI
jgi:hypothetical protein